MKAASAFARCRPSKSESVVQQKDSYEGNDAFGLTGTKKGYDHGQCGACTAIVDDRRMNTCLSLAVMHEGSKITTIEGIGRIKAMHPMQAAFIELDGFQCGYCTSGQILSAVATLDDRHARRSAECPDHT